MPTEFTRAADTAHSLLKRKGMLLEFTRANVTVVDPVTQTVTTTTLRLKMQGLGLPPGRSAEYRLGSLEGRKITEFYLAPREGAAPEPGDKVIWGGHTWTLIWLSSIDPIGAGSVFCTAYGER